MKQIGTGLQHGMAGTLPSRRDFAAPASGAPLPPVTNRRTDLEIPNSAFSSWIEAGKPRQLRRALTTEERTALERRRDEIGPALAPFADWQRDVVALAVLEMFNGFTSMRGTEEEAAARVDAALNLLADHPAWAIEKACMSIRRNGVWRDGKFDRRWPPSEPEMVAAVKEASKLYRDTFNRVEALLMAEVER